MVTWETAAILGSASPRKPMVATWSSCSGESSLLVAWRSKDKDTSSDGMPAPSSATRMNSTPPPRISTVIWEAPASIEFSTSSFTTETGRSTTSPAAIRAARAGGRILIGMAYRHYWTRRGERWCLWRDTACLQKCPWLRSPALCDRLAPFPGPESV